MRIVKENSNDIEVNVSERKIQVPEPPSRSISIIRSQSESNIIIETVQRNTLPRLSEISTPTSEKSAEQRKNSDTAASPDYDGSPDARLRSSWWAPRTSVPAKLPVGENATRTSTTSKVNETVARASITASIIESNTLEKVKKVSKVTLNLI